MVHAKGSNYGLDVGLAAFRQKVKEQNITYPSMELIKENFDNKQLKALYARLVTAKGNQDPSLQDAWDELTGPGKESKARMKPKAIREKILAEFVALPDTWTNKSS